MPVRPPKYLVSVAKDPSLPPAPENTLHLEFDLWIMMAWTLATQHAEALRQGRFLVISTRG
jgi:hypothetical protein